jgi:RHS repeat-associated protein
VKNELQFFPHPEGYVSVVKFGPENLVINYAYQYKDHLGNIRLNYGKDPETNVLKVLEENHYYPFGLKHQNYNTGRKQYGKKEDEITTLQFPGLVLPTEEKPMVYKYKYNGKEWQDELGLNFYDYHARNYDPAIGRWMNIDPLAENSRRFSPYTYALNNPIYFIDPDGMWPENPFKGLYKAFKETIKDDFSRSKMKKFNKDVIQPVKKALTKLDNAVTGSNKKVSKQGGFSIAGSGGNQETSTLTNGGRNQAEWFDVGYTLEASLLLLGHQPGKVTNPKGSIDKGTNGGKPTQIDKVENFVDAVDAGAETTKEVNEEVNKKANEKATEIKEPDFIFTNYDSDNPNNNVQVRKDVYNSEQKKKNENEKKT